MDPDTALAHIRWLMSDEGLKSYAGQGWSAYAADLMQHVEALDGWITRGGFLPKDWKQVTP